MSRISVRLPTEDEQILHQLQSQWRLDQSGAVRQALRFAYRPPLSDEGWFTAGTFQIRVKGKSHEQP